MTDEELSTDSQSEKNQGKFYSALCRLVKSVLMSVQVSVIVLNAPRQGNEKGLSLVEKGN